MKSKSSGKSAPSRSVPKRAGSVERIDVTKQMSANVRQIENGYIVSESGYVGKGRNQQYVNKEYFSKVNPVAGIKFSGSNKK